MVRRRSCRRTGGLADSVTEATARSITDGDGTGFFFEQADAEALTTALRKAIRLYRGDPTAWRMLQANGMARDFGWRLPAQAYTQVYEAALAASRKRRRARNTDDRLIPVGRQIGLGAPGTRR
jgi:starch synthase